MDEEEIKFRSKYDKFFTRPTPLKNRILSSICLVILAPLLYYIMFIPR